jgi:oxygen-independent coproporphyrinogen-3 oxidase
VPFCAVRCGYCDFNTYTATELGNDVSQATFADVMAREVALARSVLGADAPPVSTVFLGGGTPTLLPASDLVRLLASVRDGLGLAPDAEVTTEANPETVDEAALSALLEGGFTRISFGVQSTAPHVLQVLDRTHGPASSAAAIRTARAVGFDHVSADLIIGTPGETDDDLERSIETVLDAGVDHVSAYALIVEEGTPLARRVARGEVPMPQDDVAADRWELTDARLRAAGLDWYETSNWARPGGECRHNIAYWRGGNWWGIGPGAHSHVGGVRWWNLRHPSAYAARLADGQSPAQAREVLTDEQRHMEALMLGLRTREGVPVSWLTADEQARLAHLPVERIDDRVLLRAEARLLADGVVRDLLG